MSAQRRSKLKNCMNGLLIGNVCISKSALMIELEKLFGQVTHVEIKRNENNKIFFLRILFPFLSPSLYFFPSLSFPLFLSFLSLSLSLSLSLCRHLTLELSLVSIAREIGGIISTKGFPAEIVLQFRLS